MQNVIEMARNRRSFDFFKKSVNAGFPDSRGIATISGAASQHHGQAGTGPAMRGA
jgi:hypothetical protein